jgi:hypothetical protein
MKTNIQISRLFQVLLLLAFFLPFFPKGCGGSSDNYINVQHLKDSMLYSFYRADSLHFVDSVQKISSNANIDSMLYVRNKKLAMIDSIRIKMYTDSLMHSDSIKALTDTIRPKGNSTESIPSETLSKKSKILRILLRPGDNNYTGIGFVLDSFLGYLIFFGTCTAFFLFLLGLLIKYRDLEIKFYPINIIGWLFLLFTKPQGNLDELNLNFWEDKLWGYWVCLAFGVILIIYDSFILLKIRKNNTNA